MGVSGRLVTSQLEDIPMIAELRSIVAAESGWNENY